jgi:hypothetical protein
MILYKGKKHENTNQSKLLATLQNDCLGTLSHSTKLETSLVINACSVLSKDIMNGKFDHIIKPLLLAYDIPKEHFTKYVSMFTKESLERKVEIELGTDYLSLSNLNEENERYIYPLGILFHIAAGNVDALPAYSVIEGLLVGNINILKLPTGDKGLSVQLLSELIQIEPKLRDYIYVFDVPSTEVDTLKTFADIADAIVVWGGDEAVKAARKMASVNTKVIEWGHKLSFAYASVEASDDDLIGLARSIITTNQLLCSSAQGIYLDTDNRNTLDEFADRFFKLFVETQKEYTLTPFGIRSKNAVELYYEEMVQQDTGKKIWKKDGISVLTSDDRKLELSLLYRNVWIKMLPIEELVKVIKPSKNHLQTATILAPKDIYHLYLNKLIQAGIVRIKKTSEMSDVILGESHDGMFPLRIYSRVVEVYKK